MRLFSNHKKTETVVLIDISTSSVAGAYLRCTVGQPPIFLFSRRTLVELRPDEQQDKALERALKFLGEALIREGAPVVARATGSGTIKHILVSIDAPWQKTLVRNEYFEQDKPFTFNKSFLDAAIEETSRPVPGKILTDDSVIGTILNGYETDDPYEKQAHRAEIVVLSSLIEEVFANKITTLLRSIYHTKHITLMAGGSLRFQAIREAFPHEDNALVIDATGPITSIALIRNGLFVAVVDAENSQPSSDLWVKNVTTELVELSRYYPLPRIIFLLARDPMTASFLHALAGANLGNLWLSDTPPKIISIAPSHLTSLVRHDTTAPPDLLLILMALYWQHRRATRK